MGNVTKNGVLVELHVPDFKKVKDFYGKLGFEPVWERNKGDISDYLIMKMGNNLLCFWPGNQTIAQQPYFKRFPKDTKRGYGVEIIIMVDDIENFYQKAKKFANIVEPLTMRLWKLKDFRVEDPFGYYLRFTSTHNILDDKYSVD